MGVKFADKSPLYQYSGCGRTVGGKFGGHRKLFEDAFFKLYIRYDIASIKMFRHIIKQTQNQ